MPAKGSIRPDVAFRMLADNRRKNTKEREMAKKKAAKTVEQPKPAVVETVVVETPKKEKVDRRPYIQFVSNAFENPCDRKILLEQIMKKWPTVSKGGAQTFLTDALNPKYNYFKDRPVVKLADGKVVFKDKAPAAEEVQVALAEELVLAPAIEEPEIEHTEQPVE